jgi:hypothetical protein
MNDLCPYQAGVILCLASLLVARAVLVTVLVMARIVAVVSSVVVVVVLSGCGMSDTGSDTVVDATLPAFGLGDADVQELDTTFGPGTADRVEAAGQDASFCAALDAAVQATMELDAASGEDLVALLVPSQAPLAAASDASAAAGFMLTSQHWARYRDALAQTATDINLADQASKDRANARFEAVRAAAGDDTAIELGALATVCQVA